MRIAIAGAGAVGRSVAGELVDNGHKVLLIERNVSHYQPQTVPAAEWFLADACELASLQEAEMQTCDAVIAATGDDKANLTAALLAKSEFGVPRVVGRVNDARNEWLFNEAWGVDVAVSSPVAMVASVGGAIDVGHLVRLMRLRQGRAEITQLTLSSDSRIIGKAVRDLTLPTNSVLASVVRDGQALTTVSGEAFRAGDELLIVASSDVENDIARMVHGDT